METVASQTALTVLVVDDTHIHRHIIEKTLAKEGYCVIAADNGPDGRKLAMAYPPDLILLDVLMPNESGFDVLRWLKSQARTASIPVIFLTGKDDVDSKVEGFELGAVDYIVKPFHPSEVRARVRLHLQLSRAMQAMLASQAEKLKQVQEAQASLLVSPAELPQACFGIYYASLLEAGGDFYDVVPISPHIFGYFVADVSGHDIRTSFLTSALKALLKQNSAPIYQPRETIRMLNSVLLEIFPAEKYLTACYVRLNRQTHILSVVNAGHPPALYLPRHGAPRLLEPRGDILGIFPDVHHEQHELEVTPGDRLFLYSDGLVERPEQRRAWPECVGALLDVGEQLRQVEIREAARQLVALMGGETETPSDDVVVMAIEV